MVQANATKYIARCKLVDGREVEIQHLTFETESNKIYAGFAKGLIGEKVIFQTVDEFTKVVQAIFVRNIVSFTIEPIIEKDFTYFEKAQKAFEEFSLVFQPFIEKNK